MTKAMREHVNARLHELAKANGGTITAEIVIEDARDPDSPLHDSFEWNTERAAYQHWVTTADRIICGYRVMVTVENKTLSAPVFIRSIDQPKRYMRSDDMMNEKDVAMAALRREGQRVQAAIGRMQAVAAVLGLATQAEAVSVSMRSLFEAMEA